MKNFKYCFTIAFLLAFTVSLLKCSSKKSNQIIKEVSPGQITYKLTERSFGTNADNDKLDTSNGYYLMAKLTVKNNGSEPIKLDTSYFKLTDENESYLPFSVEKETFFKNFEQSLNGAIVDAQNEMQGLIIFNVPSIGNYHLHLIDPKQNKEEVIDLKK
jgi:hypothetical protein